LEKSILCIDDDNDTCELIKFVFEQAKFEVTTCLDSKEGLTWAKRRDFGVIIMDYRLEGTDGLQLCRQVRAFDQKTPITFLSDDARDYIKQSALAAGAQAFFAKPVDFEKLKDTVNNLINGLKE
jgi:DNA-binding response OmpR family regulator